MIEIVSDNRVISFDGRILEVFQSDGNAVRLHIALIRSIVLEEKRRSYRISIGYTAHNLPKVFFIEDPELTQAQHFVSVVNDAIR